jgi:hypothetical protein
LKQAQRSWNLLEYPISGKNILHRKKLSLILMSEFKYPIRMKNQNQILQHEGSAQLQAGKAIQRLHKWMEERYPRLASLKRSRMIMECMIELMVEKNMTGGSC